MIYSYIEITTAGRTGTTITYRPADKEYTDGPASVYICEYDGKHYRYVPNDLEVAEQNPQIKWTPVEINDELQLILTQYVDKDRQPNVYKECLTLESYRKYLSDKLELKAAAFEANLNKDMFFTSSLGFKSNGDRRTGTNLTNLVAMFDAMGKPTTSYRDYENKNHELNKEQLQTLFAEQVMNGNAIYTQKWEKQQAIAAAKTKADLDKIDLDFVMQDFTSE